MAEHDLPSSATPSPPLLPPPPSDAISVVPLLPAPSHIPEEDTHINSSGKRRAPRAAGGTAPEAGRKQRGRPLGSKNKPKQPIYLNHNCDARPVILEVPAGSDIIDGITQYAIRRRKCVCIISGHGSVSNVVLLNPAAPSSTLTLHGRFNILSISGFFLSCPPPPSPSRPSSSSSAPSLPPRSPVAIALAAAQGHVLGGTVSGALIAANAVFVVLTAFDQPTYHRLPYEEEDGDDARPIAMAVDAPSGGSLPLSIYGVAAPVPVNYQIPAEMTFQNSSHPPPYM